MEIKQIQCDVCKKVETTPINQKPEGWVILNSASFKIYTEGIVAYTGGLLEDGFDKPLHFCSKKCAIEALLKLFAKHQSKILERMK